MGSSGILWGSVGIQCGSGRVPCGPVKDQVGGPAKCRGAVILGIGNGADGSLDARATRNEVGVARRLGTGPGRLRHPTEALYLCTGP